MEGRRESGGGRIGDGESMRCTHSSTHVIPLLKCLRGYHLTLKCDWLFLQLTFRQSILCPASRWHGSTLDVTCTLAARKPAGTGSPE